MTQDFRLADVTVRADLGALALTDYAASSPDTLTWYDGDAQGSAEGITTAVLGRTAFMDARLTRTEAVALLTASATAPWDTVPVDATLAAADDSVRDGLYDAAEALHRHFLDAAGTGRRDHHLDGPAPHPARAVPDPRLDGPPAVRAPCRGCLAGGDPYRAALLREVVLAGDP